MIVEIKNSKEKQAISRKVLEALTDWLMRLSDSSV